jgi:hypothetical protein
LLDDRNDVASGLAHLRYLKHDVIVFHTLDHQEITLEFDGLVQFEDLENGQRLRTFPRSIRDTYQHSVRRYLEQTEKAAGRSGIDYWLMDTSQPLDRAFFAYLARRRRLM